MIKIPITATVKYSRLHHSFDIDRVNPPSSEANLMKSISCLLMSRIARVIIRIHVIEHAGSDGISKHYSDWSFNGNLTAYDTMVHELRAKLKGEEEWRLWNTREKQRNTQEVIYAIKKQ